MLALAPVFPVFSIPPDPSIGWLVLACIVASVVLVTGLVLRATGARAWLHFVLAMLVIAGGGAWTWYDMQALTQAEVELGAGQLILRGLGFETIPYEKLRLGSATVLPVRMHPGLALARIDQGSRRLGYVEAWGRTLNGRRAFVMAPAGRSEFVWIPGSDERDAFALVLAVDQPAELLKALQSLHQPQAAPAAEAQ